VGVSLDVAESRKLILETAESCWADGRASALTS
jgi:hypothetical protein